jgi:hypothetical protein
MKHEAFVVPGSTRSSAVGGVEFVVRCCGTHERSVHIQHPGKHTQEELVRIRDQHLEEIAQEHANHEAAVAFLAQLEKQVTGERASTARRDLPRPAGTGRQVTAENQQQNPLTTHGMPGQAEVTEGKQTSKAEMNDCGCG